MTPATRSYVYKVEHYSETKGVLGVGSCFTSGKFTVGGQWRIEYFPDGYDQANADCICFRLRLDGASAGAGEEEEIVVAEFAFSLLDHAGAPVPAHTSASVVGAFAAGVVPSWGFERFVERTVLESSPYLRDDSFSVRCDVTVYQPPQATAVPVRVCASPRGKVEEDVVLEVVDSKMREAHMIELVARAAVVMADLYGGVKD